MTLVVRMQAASRRGVPWLELDARVGIARVVAGGLVLAAPALFLLGGFLAQGRLDRQVRAWMAEVGPVRSPMLDSAGDGPWNRLERQLFTADASYNTKRRKEIPNDWPVTLVVSAERQATELLRQRRLPKEDLYSCVDVLAGLLTHSKELSDPNLVALGLLDATVTAPYRWSDEEAVDHALTGILLPRLASQPMSAEALRRELARLQELYQRTPSDPLQELDRNMLSSHRLWNEGMRHENYHRLRAFGYPLPLVLPALEEEWQLQHDLGDWVEKRHQVDLSSYQAMQSSLKTTFPPQASKPHSNETWARARWVGTRIYSLQIRPSLQTARLLLELRLYKAEHGTYPGELRLLAGRVDKDFQLPSWTYRVDGEKATLSRATDNILSRRVATWTLP
jgi:hypothetical protein